MFAFSYFHQFSFLFIPSLLNLMAYIMKLIQEVEGLKASQLNQCLKIERLEQELVRLFLVVFCLSCNIVLYIFSQCLNYALP